MPTGKKDDWESMNQADRITRLTQVLTRVGSDWEFRDKCLVSDSSAKEAVEAEANVNLPPGTEVQFLTEAEAEKKLIFILPPFNGGEEPTVDKFVPCTYFVYNPHKPRSKS